MSKKYCDGNCETLNTYNNISTWKVIMNKLFRREYKQKKMYFCDECIMDLLGGTWTGGGPNSSNVKKIIKLKEKNKYI